MSNKFQPGEEMFDEVTGHGISSGRAVPEDESTEGHGFWGPIVGDEENTEGHGVRIKFAVPEDEDT